MKLRCSVQHFSSKRGSALLMALVFSLVVAMMIAGAVVTTFTLGKHAQYGMQQTDALSLAEGVTEVVQKDMLTRVANFQSFPFSGSVTPDSEPYPYTITPVGSPVTRTDPDGVNLAIQTYNISATVTAGEGNARVSRIVDLTMTPIFQYMVFYEGDLEILPGPDMILEGRVHANGDIYVGTGSSSTLTVATDYLRATGDIRRDRKNDGSTTGGAVSVKVFGEENYEDMESWEDSDNPDWITLAIDTWKGTVQSGDHGVKKVEAPRIGSIKAFDPDTGDKGYYHSNADLVIVDDKAYDKDGNLLPLPPGTLTEKTMYDARERTTITVSEVDMGLLNTSGYFPANGLIYAYRTDASPSQPNGVRLANGEELLAPLTVVSEDPLFVQGDYNTVEKKGAAVITDAVNLLSNAWDDTKSPGSLPSAAETTYNLAMVTGNVPTPDGGGNYSGGLENLPRFHERWSGVRAIIRGAFVKIFDSEIGKGAWKYGADVYTAPIRDWRYDPDLQDIGNMPPFTPNAVYFKRVLWDDNLPSTLPGV